jgi:transcriptional regulator with XRE-family HTH domain
MDLKDNIKRFRELKGKSVPALAKELGVGKQSVYDWEAGKYEPSPDNIDQLCRVLDVKRKDLFDENPTPVDKAGDNNKNADPELDKVLEHLMEGNSQYILMNRELIFERYRLVSVEKIEEDKRQADERYEKEKRDHEITLKDLEERKNQIHGLYKLISEITSKIPDPGSSKIPELNKT